VNEGQSTTRMVARLQILSGGFLGPVFGRPQTNLKVHDREGSHNLLGVAPLSKSCYFVPHS